MFGVRNVAFFYSSNVSQAPTSSWMQIWGWMYGGKISREDPIPWHFKMGGIRRGNRVPSEQSFKTIGLCAIEIIK